MKDVAERRDSVVEQRDGLTMTSLLLRQYGPLMGLSDVAELLGRSPAGVRVGLYSDNDTSALLTPAKIKVGRRIYFRTVVVGDALDSLGPVANQAKRTG